MDYGTLAQLSNPGQAAPGDRWGRIRRFQNLNNIQQHALQQSIPLADLAAQKEQQQHQEYMDAAPGRRDLITLGNMNAADKLKSFDRDKFAEQLKIDVTNAEQMAKLADTTQDFSGDADAYMQAVETGDERLRNQIVKKHEGRKLRNGYVMGTDPNTDDMLLKVAGLARRHAPALQVKRDVEQTKGANRLVIENMKNLNDKEKIELRGKIAAQLQGQRLTAQANNQANRPLSASQALAAHLNKMYGDDHESWLNAYRLIQEAATTLKIDEKAAALRMFPELAAKMGEPASPRELPAPNTSPPKTSSGPVVNKPKTVVTADQARATLESKKGTPEEEKYIKFFVDAFPNEKLPDWATKR